MRCEGTCATCSWFSRTGLRPCLPPCSCLQQAAFPSGELLCHAVCLFIAMRLTCSRCCRNFGGNAIVAYNACTAFPHTQSHAINLTDIYPSLLQAHAVA